MHMLFKSARESDKAVVRTQPESVPASRSMLIPGGMAEVVAIVPPFPARLFASL